MYQRKLNESASMHNMHTCMHHTKAYIDGLM